MSRRPRINLSNLFHRPAPDLHYTACSTLQTSSVFRRVIVPQPGKFTHGVRFASKKPASFQRVATKQVFGNGEFSGWIPTRTLLAQLEAASFTTAQIEALCSVLWDRFRISQVSKHTYELLNGYCIGDFAEDDANIPKPIRVREQAMYRWSPGRPRAQSIGQHSQEDMANAVHLVGRDQLQRSIISTHATYKSRHMQLACYYLEVATMFGSTSAAVDLLKATSDGSGKLMLNEGSLAVADSVAKSLLTEIAKKEPMNCSWPVLATYMDLEYDSARLRRHSAHNLAGVISILTHVARAQKPISAPFPTSFYFEDFDNPYKYLLRIIEFCLQNFVKPPTITTADLEQLREESLQELAGQFDPEACFILAIRDEEFGSSQWQKLMMCASSAGIADAFWLLAINCWRLEGLLPGTEKPKRGFFDRWQTNQDDGFHSAKFAVYASVDNSQIGLEHRRDRDQVFLRRGLATAALYRSLGDREAGADQLSAMLDWADNNAGKISSKIVKELEDHLDDYISDQPNRRGQWTQEKCLDIVQKVTVPGLTIDALRAHPSFMKSRINVRNAESGS